MCTVTRITLVLLFAAAVASAASGPYLYDGYKDAAPPFPRSELYGKYYHNLREALPCVTTGDVFKNATNGGFTSKSSYRGTVGCQTPQGAPYYFLFPLLPEDALKLKVECDTLPRASWSHFESVVPTNQEDLNLVLMPTKKQSDAAAEPDVNVKTGGTNATYSLRCILQQIVHANEEKGANVKAFTAVRSLLDTSDMGHASPLVDVSPYGPAQHAWVPTADGEMWRGHHLTGVFFNATMTSSAEVQRIQREAHFNHHKYRASPDSLVAPRFVSETNMPMRQIKDELPEAYDSCLTLKVPTCLPVGGMSVWASTQDNISSWQNVDTPNDVPIKLTAPNSIAIMVGSSSTAFFHDVVPGADGAASGIVSLMSVINAISTSYLPQLRYMGADAPQIYFFFFVGEEYGLGGSGRFVKEVVNFKCLAYPKENTTEMGCMFPYYKYLNFTSVDLDSFEHFIVIDQVGIGGDLVYHVDQGVSTASTAQQRAEAAFAAAGARASTVGQVPPGPLFTMLKHFNASMRSAKSFTALTAYDAEFKNPNYQSSADAPQAVNVSNVVRSAQVILDVVTSLLNHRLAAADQLATPKVDVSFTTNDLWTCMAVDQKCEYFNRTFSFRPQFSEPNYYPAVFAFYQQIALTQQFVYFYAADQLKDTTGPYNNTECPCSFTELCVAGHCYPKQSFLHHSFSPALEYVNAAPIYFNQTDRSLGVGEQIWVESFWDTTLGARLTATESLTGNYLILMCGLFVSLITVGVLALLKKVVAVKLKQM